jgi:hypothetical protein
MGLGQLRSAKYKQNTFSELSPKNKIILKNPYPSKKNSFNIYKLSKKHTVYMY